MAAAACFRSQFQSKPRVAVVEGDPIVQMTAAEKLPSIEHPELVPMARHTDPPSPSQPLVGVLLGGDERGYPLGLLERYEVVNDRASDTDYVVARCALTDIAAVYDRRVGDRVLTFVNSGALWRDTLVMQDRETGTLWTPATGEAIHGPLAGQKLRPIPAVFTPLGGFPARASRRGVPRHGRGDRHPGLARAVRRVALAGRLRASRPPTAATSRRRSSSASPKGAKRSPSSGRT